MAADLPPLGQDIFYGIHWPGKSYRSEYHARRVANPQRYFARLREEHIERGGAIIEEMTEQEYNALDPDTVRRDQR